MSMSLAEIYKEKARIELGETEDVKEQRLNEFRQWIAQHDYFVDCRKDDKFLLQFLRTKKFNLDKSTQLFENYMLLKHSVPKWYNFNDNAISRVWALYQTGVAYPLIQRDEDGRRIMLVQTRKMDPKIYTFNDAIYLMTWIARVILEEEETQISGIITIIDQTDISFSHLRMLSVSDAIDFVSVLKSGAVGRQKGMYLVSLPSFASFMLEVGKKATNEKLKKRIHLIDNMEEMRNVIDPGLFPTELGGGKYSEADMMEEFKKLAGEREKLLRSIQEGVDWDRVALDGENSACSLM